MTTTNALRLTCVGFLNSFLLTFILALILMTNLHVMKRLYPSIDAINPITHLPQEMSSQNIKSNIIEKTTNQNTSPTIDIDNPNKIRETKLDMTVGSLTDISKITSQSSIEDVTAIVYLTDDIWINGTIGAIYNLREPSLGNWTGDIIILGYKINFAKKPELYKYFNCLNIKFRDITNDPLKDEFSHLHYWKNYIILHDWFRNPKSLNYFGNYEYILYLDSDVFTVRNWTYLINDNILPTIYLNEKKYHNNKIGSVYVGWREDYRFKSMYTAVIDLNKYDSNTINELKNEYPDYPEAKQANVVFFRMKYLPSVKILKSEINRILNKYGKGFWRNDQSLWNLLFYHNSSDLGFSAFNHPPEEVLFYPPIEYFPLVHTGHAEAMWKVGGWYHVLYQFWMYKLKMECPNNFIYNDGIIDS